MKIAVCGLGRAGEMLAKKIVHEKNHELVMAICRDESINAGKDVGDVLEMSKQDIPIYRMAESAKMLREKEVDVVIDFSNKNATFVLANICKEAKVNLVICTTNHSGKEWNDVKEIGEKNQIGVVYAPNLTIGINMLMEFVARASKILEGFDFEIIERHRKDKAPVTMTAKLISKAIDRGDTPISSIRVGGYVGVHEVTAANENERITIVHESFSRNAFANGALLAGEFLQGKKGFYEMNDVISDLEEQIKIK